MAKVSDVLIFPSGSVMLHGCASLRSILGFLGPWNLSGFMLCIKISNHSNILWKRHSFLYGTALSILFYRVCLGVLLNSARVPVVYISSLSPKQGCLTPRLWNKTSIRRWGDWATQIFHIPSVLYWLFWFIALHANFVWSLSIFPEQLTRTLLVLHWKWIYKSIELGRIGTLAILSLPVYSHRFALF